MFNWILNTPLECILKFIAWFHFAAFINKQTHSSIKYLKLLKNFGYFARNGGCSGMLFKNRPTITQL